MPIEIIECEQNSPEWYAARLGLPTASMFGDLLAKGEGKTRKSWINRLAAERVTGEPTESFRSAAMDRGHEFEPDARRYYALVANVDPALVGFVKNAEKGCGCSPDALIAAAGLAQFKTQRADLLIETLAKDRFPPEHIPQCQGELWITEREWIDIVVYWPKMPALIKRAHRDEAFILKLAGEVRRFNEEVEEVVDRLRRYGAESEAA